jgi:hypothetical protein
MEHPDILCGIMTFCFVALYDSVGSCKRFGGIYVL